MKPIDLDPEAADEIREAVDYLESRRRGSGDEFGEAVQDALGIVSKQPKAFAPYRTRFRKYVIKKFGYLIFYAEFDDRVWVIAVANGRRRPDYCADRKPQ